MKQSTKPAFEGPDASKPYFTVRFAMPIPPDNDYSNMGGTMVGIDEAVADYNHSAGFEIMPNGDALFITYSGPGTREGGQHMRQVQARLRHGAEDWDMPEEVTVQGVRMSDLTLSNGRRVTGAPALLWRDGSTVWLFKGGHHWQEDSRQARRGAFRVFKSMDNGVTWEIVALEPKFSSLTGDAQPITNAFRAPNGDMFVAADGPDGAGTSLLWRSSDNGLTWHDQGGRTNTRHSTIVPLDTNGTLLSVGGKDTSMDTDGITVLQDTYVRGGGYMPQNISTDWGVTFGAATTSPFPWLGGNQRPSAIKLANGNLVMVGDSRNNGAPRVAASDWTHGDGPYVALSTDNGATWTIKALPVALQHSTRIHKTLGYVIVRQAPNGVIHVLSSRTHPVLHYEFNEAWITDPSAGDIAPETAGGKIKSYKEKYPGGKLRAKWKARVTPGGRYLLDGVEKYYYPNGKKQREVTWVSGRRTGTETLWAPEGTRIWSWNHDLTNNVSVWTHWWPNGQKRLESQWNNNPAARDLPTRHFRGLVAHGTARHWNENGIEVGAYTFLNGVRISQRGNHTEDFDQKSPDPGNRGWTGYGNTSGGNNFGWSQNTSWNTFVNRTGASRSIGEAGGVFARSSTYRWYADTSIGAKNRTQNLHLSGHLYMNRPGNFEGTLRIGYFNTSNPGGNFIGIEFREPAGAILDTLDHHSGEVFRAYLTVRGPGGTTISEEPYEMFTFASHPKTFDLIWNANADGSGTLSGTIISLPLSLTVPSGSGSFNAFGMMVGGDSSDDPTRQTGGVYFDNLNYDKGIVTTYIVTYNANGASSGSVPSDQTKPHGVELPISPSSDLVRKGFTFAGWNTASDGSGKSYAPGSLYTVNANVTLYAKWTKTIRLSTRKRKIQTN